MLKKALAAILVFVMLVSVLSVAASALAPAAAEVKALSAEMSFSDRLSSYLYYVLDRLLNWMLSYLNLYTPKQDWVMKEDYQPVNFFEGTEAFSSTAEDGAKWYLGYSSASLLEGQDVLDGKHYMGGSLSLLEPKVCTAVIDD
ncbi:MAG TPA: hypothetical protein PKN28_05920 [Clostridiales bacterium]|nr:hypothetical protein [Clostridiales bacterium]